MKWFLPFVFIFASKAVFAAPSDTPVLSPDNKKVMEDKSSREYSVTDDGAWHFALGGGLSLGHTAFFSEGTVSGSTDKFDALITFGPTVELVAEARWMRPYAWGFTGGLQLGSEAKADKYEIKQGGTTTKGDADAKIQLTTLYGNAVYRWHWIYLPFGLNVTSVKMTPSSGYTGSIDSKGGIGTQVGVGFLVHPNIALETHMFINNWKLEGKSGTTTFDYGTGSLFSWKLQAKYVF